MARIAISLLLCLTLAGTFTSCDKDTCSHFDHRAMARCFDPAAWDTMLVADELVGTWQLRTRTCPDGFTNYFIDGRGGQSLTVVFSADRTLEAIYDTDLVMTAEWQVMRPTSNSYSLAVEPWIPELAGFVLLCGNIVEFNTSGLDGVDQFFYQQ